MSSATLLANKAGLNAYHRATDANYTLTVRTADGTGSGWAGADERDWGKIDGGAIAAPRAGEGTPVARRPSPPNPAGIRWCWSHRRSVTSCSS